VPAVGKVHIKGARQQELMPRVPRTCCQIAASPCCPSSFPLSGHPRLHALKWSSSSSSSSSSRSRHMLCLKQSLMHRLTLSCVDGRALRIAQKSWRTETRACACWPASKATSYLYAWHTPTAKTTARPSFRYSLFFCGQVLRTVCSEAACYLSQLFCPRNSSQQST